VFKLFILSHGSDEVPDGIEDDGYKGVRIFTDLTPEIGNYFTPKDVYNALDNNEILQKCLKITFFGVTIFGLQLYVK